MTRAVLTSNHRIWNDTIGSSQIQSEPAVEMQMWRLAVLKVFHSPFRNIRRNILYQIRWFEVHDESEG